MNRFRLRQLETVLGRGPRDQLCQNCGGLSIEQIFDAMLVQDGLTRGDRELADQIIAELDSQPATCMICNDLTSAGELMKMDDLGNGGKNQDAEETKAPHHHAREKAEGPPRVAVTIITGRSLGGSFQSGEKTGETEAQTVRGALRKTCRMRSAESSQPNHPTSRAANADRVVRFHIQRNGHDENIFNYSGCGVSGM